MAVWQYYPLIYAKELFATNPPHPSALDDAGACPILEQAGATTLLAWLCRTCQPFQCAISAGESVPAL